MVQMQQGLLRRASALCKFFFICLVVGTLAVCATVLVQAMSNPAYADTTTQTTANGKTLIRYDGADRYDTSNLVNASLAEASSYRGVIVCSANDDAYADALCAAGLSGVLDYPIVLVDAAVNTLAAESSATITSLLGESKGDIIIIGGTSTVTAEIESALARLDEDGKITRICGQDRFETSEVVYDYGARHGGWAYDYAVVVQGNDFPDALCAASFCAAGSYPLLLTDSTLTSLEPYVVAAAQSARDIIVVGGTSSVSVEKENALKGCGNVRRIGGDTRYATNLSFVEWELSCGMSVDTVGVASGQTYPDALGSSFILASSASVLLIASKNEDENDALYKFIGANSAYIDTVEIFGGRASVTGRTKAVIREQLCDEAEGAAWYDTNKLICHAMGMIDDHTYLNCKEAMELNYELGFRVFECDLSLTSDGALVGVHDWNGWKNSLVEGQFDGTLPATKEEFLSYKMYGQYTGLCIEDIFLFMEDHPDFWLVTDTKETDPELYREQFRVMVNAAEAIGCTDVLDRVIVQIYHDYMYDDIYEIYPFSNWIYTLYLEDFAGQPDKLAKFADFCNEYDIAVITMWNYLCTDEIISLAQDYGVQLFVHTVNDAQAKEEFLANDVGVFTDIY